MNITWSGGAKGGVTGIRGSNVVTSLDELITLVRETSNELSSADARRLGSCAFFMALRDSRFSPDAQTAARRTLDSYFAVLPNPKVDQAFQGGIAEIQAVLFEERARPAYELVQLAYSYLQRCFGQSSS